MLPKNIFLTVDKLLSATFFSPTIPHLKIDLEFTDKAKLQSWASAAKKNYSLKTINHEYVKASLTLKDLRVDGRLKLKGTTAIHHFGGKKWSYRVKTGDDRRLFGMKSFAIMDPVRRGNLWQIAYNFAARDEGLITKRYDLIDLTVNGEKIGVHVIEESLGVDLLESNFRREGLILRLNAESLWSEKAAYTLSPMEWGDYFYSAQLTADSEEAVFANPETRDSFYSISRKFEAFKRGSIQTHELFDVDQMAKFMATTAVFSGWHGALGFSVVFYLNPMTGKLEPIVDDTYSETNIAQGWRDKYYIDEFTRTLIRDPIFASALIKNLVRVSSKKYLENYQNKHGDKLAQNLSVLWRDDLSVASPYQIISDNQQDIRETLKPHEPLIAFVEYTSKENDLIIRAAPTKTLLPIEILGLVDSSNIKLSFPEYCAPYPSCVKTNTLVPEDFIAVPVKSNENPFHNVVATSGYGSPREFKSIKFELNESGETTPPQSDISTLAREAQLHVAFKILGTSEPYFLPLTPPPDSLQPTVNYEAEIYSDALTNLAAYEFIVVDEIKKQIYVKQGDWKISQNIVFPIGYDAIFMGGTNLKLDNRASIISFGSLKILGSKTNPVRVFAENNFGGGVIAFGKENKHVVRNAIFDGLSQIKSGDIKSTGAVVFYDTNVNIDSSTFKNNTAEDSLNIMLSEFLISNTNFLNSKSDALDVDFSSGHIQGVVSENSHNDGLDFSGSDIKIVDATIKNAGDKAISAGEGSVIDIEKLSIQGSLVGVASKDLSSVTIKNSIINNCFFAISAYQKKWKFGPARVEISDTKFEENKYQTLLETRSTIQIDGISSQPSSDSVFETLYVSPNNELTEFQNTLMSRLQ